MIYYEINTISVWYFPAKYLKTFFLIIKASLNEKIFFKIYLFYLYHHYLIESRIT